MSDLAYFQRRLATAQSFTGLPPQSRYDLAASTIDDDTLEETGAMFGGPPVGSGGFGLSDITTELLSRDPKYIPVEDLALYQQNLKATGYLHPGYQVTGEWDAPSAAAQRRSERDAMDQVRSGSHFLAMPVRKFFEYMTYTTPKSVIEGAFGIAKGIWEDAATTAQNPVQVFEEGGLIGGAAVGLGAGAATGAAIGAFGGPIGAGAGALIGGAAGAVGGFFADFFGDDEQEENEDGWQRFWDAWTPLDEIQAGDASNFFAGLSTVMTASAVLKGASVGVKGVQGALASPSLAAGATGTVRAGGLRQAFSLAARNNVSEGMAAKLAQAAVRKPIVGGAVIGGTVDAFPEFLQGDFSGAASDFVSGAMTGAAVGGAWKLTGKKGAERIVKGLQAAPLRRVEQSGAGQVVRAGYTGLASATIGGRLTGELPGEQSVEKAIKETDVGAVGHALDWTLGLAVYPERLLPWRARDMSRAMTELGSNRLLDPIARAYQTTTDAAGRIITRSKKEAYQKAIEDLGKRTPDSEVDTALLSQNVGFIYMNKGLDDIAEMNALTRSKELESEGPLRAFDEDRIRAEERSKLVQQMYDEAGQIEVTSPVDELAALFSTPTGKRLFEHARKNPGGMESYATELGPGSLAAAGEHQNASRFLMERTRAMRGESVTAPRTARMPDDGSVVTDETLGEIDEVIAALRAEGDKSFISDRIAELEARKARIASLLDESGPSQKAEGIFLTPAVRDDPANGVTGYQTRDHFNQAAKDYKEAAERFRIAKERAAGLAEDTPEWMELTRSSEALDTVLLDLKRRGMIDQPQIAELGSTVSNPVVDAALVERLETIAKTRPFEIAEETARLQEKGFDRYIALSTGENMLMYDHIPKNLEISGVSELTRRSGFRDALAGMARRVDRLDVGRLRYQSIVTHLDGIAQKYGFESGQEIADKLYNAVTSRYDQQAALARGETIAIGRSGVRVRRTSRKTGEVKKEWYRVVPQDLNAKDIQKALDLDAPINDVDPLQIAGEIKNRLMVGAAFGADMAHPLSTARNLVTNLRIQGLPGFAEAIRAMEWPLHKLPGRWGIKAKEGSYGYISHHLRNAHMAVQFSISPTFDASRYVEAMSFGKMHDLPVKAALGPAKFIREQHPEGGWLSPYSSERVTGRKAYQEHIRLADEVMHGRPVMQQFDELQMRSMHHGILGFKPREVEAAHVWALAQKKLAKKGRLDPDDYQEIRETVLQIHQYGSKQTAFGNSMHFVFFPFLFGFKQLRQIHDFTLGAPTRNLLVHEGFRRWNSIVDDEGRPTTLGKKFVEDFKESVPLANELARLNNLSYGMSLGRFFLEGWQDVTGPDGKTIADKSVIGKVAQGIASFLMPGGVHQPVADTVGQSAEALKNFFVPVVLLDDGEQFTWSDQLLDIPRRLAPIYRDIDRWFMNSEYGDFGVVGQTVSTLAEGQSPMGQFQELLDFKRVEGIALDAMAQNAGYASWDSLSSSQPELAAQVKDINLAVESQYPSGAELANRFENSDKQKDQAVYSIATKERKTEAEEAIFTIATIEQQADLLAAQTGRTQEEMHRLIAPIVRGLAFSYVDDRQFNSLFDELFASTYGPLRVVAT